MDSKFLKNVSRRTFLKGTVATSAAVALAGCSTDDEALIFPETAGTVVESVVYPEETFKGVCRPNCWSSCQMDVTVRNNKVVRTKRARMGQNETGVPGLNEEGYYDRICLRGLSHVQRMYRPERILYPMKRVSGQRGDLNGFAKITWAEAIETIAQKIVDITATDSRAFAFATGSQVYGEVTGGGPLGRLGASLGFTNIGASLDMALPVGTERVFGAARFPFFSTNELSDMVNANTIFAWSSNITETQIQSWHFMADALDVRKRKKIKASGKAQVANLKDKATLVSVDPMYTVIASKSDYYVAPRVGSDTAIALGILREIMFTHEALNDGWIDWEYLFQDSVAPFLVNPSTGRFLRQSDITGDTSNDADKRYVMWNKAGNYEYTTPSVNSNLPSPFFSAVAWQDAERTELINTALTNDDVEMLNEVSVTLNGEATPITCKPAYLLLKESVAEWTLEKTSEYSSLSQDVIKKLAELYGHPDNKPVFNYVGFGTDHYTNGHHFSHTVATLACITGNVGKSGASCGLFIPFGFARANVPMTVSNPATSISYLAIGDVVETQQYNGSAYPEIKGLWVAGGNPISNWSDQKAYFIDKIVNNIDFIVTSEVTMTDTCAYSDLILPACYWFECVDMVSKANHPFMVLNEQAIEPIGSSISDWQISKRVAEAIDAKISNGISANFAYTEEEYLKIMVDNSAVNAIYPTILTGDKKISWDNLKEQKVLRYLSNDAGDGPYIHCEDKIYRGTNTFRAEFYSESPFVLGLPTDWAKERIPTWENPTEAWDGDGHNATLLAQYPLAYQQEHQRWKVHSQWFDAEWMDELAGEPAVYIHPTDATTYGNIVTGDTVKVSNARGFATVKAIVTEKMPVGQVSIPKGIQRHQFIAGGADNSGCFQELTSVTAFHPAVANQAFYDVRVKVEKV